MSAGRILVVDDEPQIRRIMRTTLTGAGYEVDDAKTGEEALEKLRDYHPDLVLLDMNMPGMGGLAACREIRAGTGVGIIMLTVRNTEADKVQALDAGADDFVNKPFSTPELLARIRAALRRVPASPQSSPTRIRIGKLVIDFAAALLLMASAPAISRPRSWIWCATSPAMPTKPYPTANSCRRSGVPTMAIRWTTCACSSEICEKKSNPIPITLNLSAPNLGWVIASTARPNPFERRAEFCGKRRRAGEGDPFSHGLPDRLVLKCATVLQPLDVLAACKPRLFASTSTGLRDSLQVLRPACRYPRQCFIRLTASCWNPGYRLDRLFTPSRFLRHGRR